MSGYDIDYQQSNTIELTTQEIVRELWATLPEVKWRYKIQILAYLYQVVYRKRLHNFVWQYPLLVVTLIHLEPITTAIRRLIRLASVVEFPLFYIPETTSDALVQFLNLALFFLLTLLASMVFNPR